MSNKRKDGTMSFTGERYIPGEGGFQIAYEHLHRYVFALRWAAGRQVLDLACGSGYGTALLAQRATHVWAVDLDMNTIRCASKDWHKDNVSFIRGDAVQLPFRNGSMGLVVAMEALEHIRDQEKLVQEMARVCSTSGSVLISTPNKAVYSNARRYVNPFHIRELYFDEFVHLLKRHFPYVQIAGQQIRSGSLLSCNTSETLCEVIAEPVLEPKNAGTAHMYFVAVCSMEELRDPVPSHSAYMDLTDGLILELKQEIDKRGQWAKGLEGVIRERDQLIRDLQRKMAEEVGLRDQTITDLLNSLRLKEQEFDDRGKWALSLDAEVEVLRRIRRTLLHRILSRIGLLPK
jgi:ubiquinone/menaquinone biosynthesis C-methylase UbiE